MWPWRRKGKHRLGAAVTAIPSAPVRPVVPPPVVTPPPSHDQRELGQVPEAPERASSAVDHEVAGEVPAQPAGPRVELTFADGSTTALDAEQARALDEIAQVLTRKD